VGVTQTIREEAWIGDAVLSLFVREWLLSNANRSPVENQELFELFVSNQFLSSFGEPTHVEAEIGRVYRENGLNPTFDYLRTRFLERFIRTARNKGMKLSSQC
jgi:hypothetical protein